MYRPCRMMCWHDEKKTMLLFTVHDILYDQQYGIKCMIENGVRSTQ